MHMIALYIHCLPEYELPTRIRNPTRIPNLGPRFVFHREPKCTNGVTIRIDTDASWVSFRFWELRPV